MKAHFNFKSFTTIGAILLFFFSGVMTSCEPEELRLSRSQRKIVDSLVQQKTVGNRDMLDSLCDIRMAEELAAVTDSIVEERMAEIRRKMEADAKAN